MIDRLLELLRREPIRFTQLATAIGTVLVWFGADDAKLAVLGAVLLPVLEFVRAMVMPTVKVEAVATSAAATTVSALDEGTIGAVGDITETAADAIDSAVTGTLALAGIGSRRNGPLDAATAVHPAARITVDPDSIARAVGCCLDVTVDGRLVGREETAVDE